MAEADVSESLEYLNENADALAEYAATDGSTAGKTVLALTVAGSDPNDFSGYDFVLSLTEHLLPTGQFNVNTAFNQSLAILGLAIVGEDIPNEAIDWLLELQETEGDFTGSWDDGFGTAGNADSTAMAIMAISLGARKRPAGKRRLGIWPGIWRECQQHRPGYSSLVCSQAGHGQRGKPLDTEWDYSPGSLDRLAGRQWRLSG